MASTYVNDLRLEEIGTGDQSGTWGNTTNLNLELIGQALGYGTQQSFSADADVTTTIADGAVDPARAMYFKVTSAGNLTATRTLTIAPNTISRVMFIENATGGSQSIAISQGSGANVTIATGKTAVVYLDGAGATAAVVDAMAGVDPGVTDTLTEVLVAGNTSGGTNIELSTTDKVQFRDAAIYLNSSVDGQLDIVADTEIQIAATTVDLNGNLDVSGTALVTGVLTTTAATVFNGGFASNADSTLGTDKKVQFRDSAIYINSSVDGQLDIVADTEIQIATTTVDINGAVDVSGTLGVTGVATLASLVATTADINAGTIDGTVIGGTTAAAISGTTGQFGTSLNVDGTATINSFLQTNSANYQHKFFLADGTTGVGYIYSTGSTFQFDTQAAQPMDLLVNGASRLTLGTSGSATFTPTTAGHAVFNENGVDADFRVESDNNTHALYVDGEDGNVGINSTATNARLEVVATSGEVFRADCDGGAYRVVVNQTGVNMNGLVGIGTTNPVAQFAVGAAGRRIEFDGGSGVIRGFDRTASWAGIDFEASAYTFDCSTARMLDIAATGVIINEDSADADFRVESNGNANMLFVDGGSNKVGIGRDPQDNGSTLQVAADATASTNLQLTLRGLSNENKQLVLGFDTTSNIASITSFEAGVSHRPLHLQGSEFVWNESGSDHDFRVESVSNANMLHVDGYNNGVGIGTTGTTTPLTVNGGTSSIATIQLGNHGDNASIHAKYNLAFKADSTETIADRSIGFSIGTHSAFYSTVAGTVFNELGADADFRVESTNGSAMLCVDGADDVVLIDNTSFSAIDGRSGTGVALRRLGRAVFTCTNGGNAIEFNGLSQAGAAGSINVSGTTTTYNTSSDVRLKENIADADDAGSKIDAIQVRKYDWKADGLHQDYGMIAQELQVVAPEAVSGDADSEEMMGVDYSKLVPMLIKEIQSLRARVADLES